MEKKIYIVSEIEFVDGEPVICALPFEFESDAKSCAKQAIEGFKERNTDKVYEQSYDNYDGFFAKEPSGNILFKIQIDEYSIH